MKRLRKIMSVLLAFALVAAVLVPTALAEGAQNDAAVKWDEFYIKSQTEENIKIDTDEPFELYVEVNVPEGAEISYQWYTSNGLWNKCEGFVDAVADFSDTANKAYPKSDTTYMCRVTAVVKNESGEILDSCAIETNPIEVRIKMTFSEKLGYVTLKPIEVAFNAAIMLTGMSYGVFLPISPLVFVGGAIYAFFYGIGYVAKH